jgi:hypothetical protein
MHVNGKDPFEFMPLSKITVKVAGKVGVYLDNLISEMVGI